MVVVGSEQVYAGLSFSSLVPSHQRNTPRTAECKALNGLVIMTFGHKRVLLSMNRMARPKRYAMLSL